MSEPDLNSLWAVLQTEATGPDAGIEAVPAGVELEAGDVLVGVDHAGRRHVMIPLRPGEAFAEDRSGSSVHLLRIDYGHCGYLSAVCLKSDLVSVFAQFVQEILREVVTAASPARATVEALAHWRRLFAEADTAGVLSEARLVGLMAEVVTLEQILVRDDRRRLEVWTGPSGSPHDFRSGSEAIEVKGTLVREGRIVSISSVEQLAAPPAGRLHLAHYRFEPDPDGDSLPDLLDRVRDLGVEHDRLDQMLTKAGYRSSHVEHYVHRTYRVLDRRVYDVEAPSFPRIIPSSFVGGVTPVGTLRLSYSVDLSNEPPVPLSDGLVDTVLRGLAGSL